jgi:hypothetical protein
MPAHHGTKEEKSPGQKSGRYKINRDKQIQINGRHALAPAN